MTVSENLASAIAALKLSLQAEFGFDFAFTIIGKGEIVAANNLTHGVIAPQTPEYGVAIGGRVGIVKRSPTGKITVLSHREDGEIRNSPRTNIKPAVISKGKVFFLATWGVREVQLRVASLDGHDIVTPILSLRDLKSTEFTEADIERIKITLINRS